MTRDLRGPALDAGRELVYRRRRVGRPQSDRAGRSQTCHRRLRANELIRGFGKRVVARLGGRSKDLQPPAQQLDSARPPVGGNGPDFPANPYIHNTC